MDIGVGEGDEIPFYYDPMIAKIISLGKNREEAIKILIDFLLEFKLEGINTNQFFLITLLQNQTFKKALHNTKFIENNLELLIKNLDITSKNDEKIVAGVPEGMV